MTFQYPNTIAIRHMWWDLILPSKLVRACARARFHGLVLDVLEILPCIHGTPLKTPLGKKGMLLMAHGRFSLASMSLPYIFGPLNGCCSRPHRWLFAVSLEVMTAYAHPPRMSPYQSHLLFPFSF